MQAPANLARQAPGHRGRVPSPGSSVRARCSRCTASATARRSQAYPVRSARGRVRRRLHRHHRHRVGTRPRTHRGRPAPRSSRSSTTPARAALFVDFDGSLVADRRRPGAAAAAPRGARRAGAARARSLGRVAVVSGRPAAFLRDALGDRRRSTTPAPTGSSGSSTARWWSTTARRAVPRRDRAGRRRGRGRAARAARRAQGPGRGHHPLARRSPTRGDEAQAWAAEARAARYGLDAPLRGRMAVELRPPVPVDKGTTVAELVARRMRSPRSRATTPATSPRSPRSHALVADGRARARGAHRRDVGREPARAPRRRRRRRRARGPGGAARRRSPTRSARRG